VTRLKRWVPWGLLVAVAVAALVAGLHRSSNPTLDARVTHIASEVRCPVCNGESAAESQAAPSVQIRNEIRTDLQHGMSANQILDGFVASYGPGILEKPQAKGMGLVVWVLPVVAVALAALALVLVLARWHQQPAEPTLAVVDAGPSGGPDTPDYPADPLMSPADAGSLDRPPATTGAALAADEQEATAPTVPRTALATGDSSPGADLVAAPRSRGGRRRALAALVTVTVAVAGSWAIVHALTVRLPGQPVTGSALGPQVVLADLQKARAYESKGDLVDAVKSYQAVLADNPTQVNALTEEGWLLAQTGEPSLLQQGLAMLHAAEQSSPSFAEAHLYRGLALLSEDDYADTIPELRWYLGHQPDPQAVSAVQTALRRAEAGLKAGPTTTSRP
jgi:cytochrome c-type biogenesis protein CcmH